MKVVLDFKGVVDGTLLVHGLCDWPGRITELVSQEQVWAWTGSYWLEEEAFSSDIVANLGFWKYNFLDLVTLKDF